MIEPRCLTMAAMLCGARFRPGQNGFAGGINGFVRTGRAGAPLLKTVADL